MTNTDATMTTAKQRGTSRDHLARLPAELIGLVVQHTLDAAAGMGSEQDAIALASTNRAMYEKTIHMIWSHAVSKSSVYILHWAADHARLDTIKLAMSYGANPNKPLTSVFEFYHHDTKYHRRPECSSALSTSHGLEFYVVQRARLIKKKVWSAKQWYRADTLEAIDRTQFSNLVDWYCAAPVARGGDGDALVAIAEEVATKILLLRAFRFWITPLHIAVREGHKEIIDYLVHNGADPDVTAYGTCICHQIKSINLRPTSAFSPLHQAICNSCTDDAMERSLIQAGSSYLELSKSTLSGGSLVQPTFTLPRNLLHEVLRGFEGNWGVRELLESGWESRLEERDELGQFAVDIAIEYNLDSDIIKSLFSKDMMSGATLVQAPGPFDLLIDDRCSVLIWAILSGEWPFALKLLGKPEDGDAVFDPELPSSDTTVVTTVSRITALHAVCMEPQEDVDAILDGRSREIVYRTLLEIDRTQVNALSADNRTPLTEAMICVAKLYCNREDFLETTEARIVLALLGHGADPFEGIETDQCPIEVFLDTSAEWHNFRLYWGKDATAVLQILTAIDFDQYRREPLQLQQYDRVFQLLKSDDLSQMEMIRRILAGVRTGVVPDDEMEEPV